MRFKHWLQRSVWIVALAAMLAGCATATPTLAPTAMATTDPQPTLNAMGTQAAKTVVADLTKNAPSATPVTPTATLAPSATTAPSATLAPTRPVIPTALPTATVSAVTITPLISSTPQAYSCTITEVTPKSTDKFAPRADFDGKWIVKNTGSQTWDAQAVDIVYSSGTKMQKKTDSQDLTADVAANASLTVIVDMTAPDAVGTYTTTWLIVRGSQTLCTLNLTVNVAN